MSNYDPDRHHRRSIRLQGYDYTQAGLYFVTIVAFGRELLFENSIFKRIVETYWKKIPQHFDSVSLDEFVVMPNHLHGIILIEDARRGEALPKVSPLTGHRTTIQRKRTVNNVVGNASPLQSAMPRAVDSGSLGAIVGNFKSITARRINAVRHSPSAPVWQRNYYEHIVRHEDDLNRIRAYILNNPTQWASDQENPMYDIASKSSKEESFGQL
ncbi:MAG TPA: transposase [Anaerolineae bacterium]|nr:transposase [Anaerolineae bacterium]